MMLGSENLDMFLRVATVVVPVGLYFLILGILNSRCRPQMLTGRQDFSLLILAMSPLFVIPLLNVFGATPITAVIVLALLAGGIGLLAPSGRNWVIYNMTPSAARRVIKRTLDEMGVDVDADERYFHLHDRNTTIELRHFPLLRNVTVRVVGRNAVFAERFGEVLRRMVTACEAETGAMAVAMLLVSVAMLVGPLVLLAQRLPAIVRVVTDLLP